MNKKKVNIVKDYFENCEIEKLKRIKENYILELSILQIVLDRKEKKNDKC